jgi:hypothetical protein
MATAIVSAGAPEGPVTVFPTPAVHRGHCTGEPAFGRHFTASNHSHSAPSPAPPCRKACSPITVPRASNKVTWCVSDDPDILIADEPVSALDVSVQRQILELLAERRDRLHLTMLFITHDLRVAAQICDSVAVMWQGEVVEYGATAQIFGAPRHLYTQELLAAIPGKNWEAAGLQRAGGL